MKQPDWLRMNADAAIPSNKRRMSTSEVGDGVEAIASSVVLRCE
jgi:hypothetical protein